MGTISGWRCWPGQAAFGASVVHGSDELVGFGLNAFRINLTSLFGGVWPTARIAQAARGATISKMWLSWEYHHHYLPRLTATPEPPRLEPPPPAPAAPEAPGTIEVGLPSGATVRVSGRVDPGMLRAVLAELGGR